MSIGEYFINFIRYHSPAKRHALMPLTLFNMSDNKKNGPAPTKPAPVPEQKRSPSPHGGRLSQESHNSVTPRVPVPTKTTRPKK